jgi:hypothetical protein
MRPTAAGGIALAEFGGDEGTRTPDPRDANAVLSQLSYIPTQDDGRWGLVERMGV